VRENIGKRNAQTHQRRVRARDRIVIAVSKTFALARTAATALWRAESSTGWLLTSAPGKACHTRTSVMRMDVNCSIAAVEAAVAHIVQTRSLMHQSAF
jgi:hypothetical protein